jgi:hypothetical protein
LDDLNKKLAWCPEKERACGKKTTRELGVIKELVAGKNTEGGYPENSIPRHDGTKIGTGTCENQTRAAKKQVPKQLQQEREKKARVKRDAVFLRGATGEQKKEGRSEKTETQAKKNTKNLENTRYGSNSSALKSYHLVESSKVAASMSF